MKMKRFVAADMRSALKAIREEQGPDAVILSSRTVPQGVEVCAAVDLELAGGQGTLAETAALKQLERSTLQLLAQEELDTEARTRDAETDGTMTDNALFDRPMAGPAGEANGFSVGEELRSLRALLEQQLAALAWNDFTRREPLKARALVDMAALGLDRSLALSIVGDLPAGLSAEQMQRAPYAALARAIQISPAPIERTSAVALIGPPGSGKTTTLSKLAARYVLEHDAANLVILSADDDRLGSHEQLKSLGRVLGVRVEAVAGLSELAARVEALRGRCILIDTPGAASRDNASAAGYRALRNRCPSLQMMLVLPASAQGGVIDDSVANFGVGLATCCALTRVDEAVSLGAALSALVRSRLPLAYYCDGARIPDDLRPARAHQLVVRAVELARQTQGCADDDLLARRYGGSVHVAA